ncbi:MAG: DinB family protein [Pyrinomonadaceae bacterium]
MSETAENFIAKARSLMREDYLPKIERCLEKLNDEQVWWRAGEESNSIGNLLLHMAGNARQWIISSVGGERDARVRQQEFDERETIPRAELMEKLRRTLDEVDAVLARVDEAQLLERRTIQGYEVTVLEAIFHAVEHLAMHTGQIILITKMLTRSDMKFYEL